jgi:hypothetical protein
MVRVLAGVLIPAIAAGVKLVGATVAVTKFVDKFDEAGGGKVTLRKVADPYAPMRGEAGVELVLDDEGTKAAKVHLGCYLDMARKHPDAGPDELIKASDKAAQEMGVSSYRDLLTQDRRNRKEHGDKFPD